MCNQGGDRGSVLVELALVLPVLLLFLLAAVEFGLVFNEYQVLQNAVREGARFSALPINQASLNDPNRAAKMTAIQQFVLNYCSAQIVTPPLTAAEITINQNYSIPISLANYGVTAVTGSQVSIVHTHTLLTGGAFLPGGGTLTLQASAVFRNMY